MSNEAITPKERALAIIRGLPEDSSLGEILRALASAPAVDDEPAGVGAEGAVQARTVTGGELLEIYRDHGPFLSEEGLRSIEELKAEESIRHHPIVERLTGLIPSDADADAVRAERLRDKHD